MGTRAIQRRHPQAQTISPSQAGRSLSKQAGELEKAFPIRHVPLPVGREASCSGWCPVSWRWRGWGRMWGDFMSKRLKTQEHLLSSPARDRGEVLLWLEPQQDGGCFWETRSRLFHPLGRGPCGAQWPSWSVATGCRPPDDELSGTHASVALRGVRTGGLPGREVRVC